MPIVSIKKGILGSGILKKAAGSTPNSYTPKKLENFLKRGKTSTPYGSITYKRLFEKNQTMDKKKFKEMYESGQKEGVFGKFYSAEDQFNKAVREEKRITLEEIKKTKESQNIPAKNKQPKTVKPEDKKASNIAASRVENERAKRGREIGSISKLDQVREAQSKFRKTWGKSSEIEVISRGAPIEGKGGLIGHAVKEEEKSDSSNKSGQKKGGNAPAGQKSGGPPEARLAKGGHQPVKLQGSAGIDQLTHRQEVAKGENLPGGVYHVDGLDKAPASQPEISPAPRSASASEDISDMDI